MRSSSFHSIEWDWPGFSNQGRACGCGTPSTPFPLPSLPPSPADVLKCRLMIAIEPRRRCNAMRVIRGTGFSHRPTPTGLPNPIRSLGPGRRNDGEGETGSATQPRGGRVAEPDPIRQLISDLASFISGGKRKRDGVQQPAHFSPPSRVAEPDAIQVA